MSKEFLRSGEKMDAAGYVENARKMARTLEDREAAVVGSRPIARARIARLSGVSGSLLHSLRYRAPKRIAADAYARLCAATEEAAIHQIRKAFDELATARKCRPGLNGDDLAEIEAALAKAYALLGATNGKTEKELNR